MLFKNIDILDENFEIQKDVFVGVSGDRIRYIGKTRPSEDFGDEYDGRNKLLMSGFYNAHAHTAMTLLRGYGENMTLQDWLFTRIFPFEAQLTPKAVYWGTLLSMAESMRFGIVSSSDMYYFTDEIVRAVVESGEKINVTRAVAIPDNEPWKFPAIREMKEAFERYNGYADGAVKVDMSIHAEYTCSDATVRTVTEYTKSVNAIMHIHVSETRSEHEGCKERHGGLTPVQYFNKMGSWDTPAIAAHCIYIEGEDYDILKEKGVTVASNPNSNLKLSSGVCNVPELLRRGIRVAIGTDSVASNNSLNFFEEMKAFALTGKMMFNDPTVVTPKETLYAATRAGALAQGRTDCGLLKEGFKADLIVVDTHKPNMVPVHDMRNNLVYSADGGDILMTMVDGKVIYENGEYRTIDIDKVIFEAQNCTDEILKKLKQV